jgi:predicted 2-oxoglutarate/Fe(II)-dependent dioxygenase YbiX
MANIPVATGDIVLFPSKITHSVAPTQGKHLRTTLAFNSFIKGNIREGLHLLDLDL